MIYVGFGFLLTFMHRLKLSCLTMCFWVAAISVQYYFLWNALWEGAFEIYGDFLITPEKLILGEVSAGAMLIALCAIIGKTNNFQFLIIAIWGEFLYTLNEYIVIAEIGCRDVGGAMIIHAFGAFYGIGLTWGMYKRNSWEYKHLFSPHSSYSMAMIGTLFLWCFWPSFNAALATTPVEIHMAVLNTYFSIIGSVLGAYWICAL